jgi:HD superfamily phosphohydrolase YqeK
MIDFFKQEIDLIENVVIQNFTRYALERAPQYLALVPSSSTKKYHPPQSNEEPGGLLNHLKTTVSFGVMGCRMYNLDKDTKDAVIAACLLHDIVKYSDYEKGIEIKQKYTTKTHDYDGAMFLYKLAGKFKEETGQEVPLIDTILGAVAWHMGRWTVRKNPAHVVKRFPEDYEPHEIIVHFADMCAAHPDFHNLRLESGIAVG